jgi:hypothetical protein
VDNSTADIAIVREKTLFNIGAPPTVFFPAIALNIVAIAEEDEEEDETTFAVAAAFAAERAAWTLILRNNMAVIFFNRCPKCVL